MKPSPQPYTVVAAYSEPVQLFCVTVEALTPDQAIDLAWGECKDGNGWEEADINDDWSDVMVISGSVEVVA